MQNETRLKWSTLEVYASLWDIFGKTSKFWPGVLLPFAALLV
jgi:hypothetical protein